MGQVRKVTGSIPVSSIANLGVGSAVKCPCSLMDRILPSEGSDAGSIPARDNE